MSIPIEMPQLSSEGEAATLATWLVAVGDQVAKGDVIAELETDKATVELEAPASGTILALSLAEGSEGVLPGVVLGTIDPDDEGGEMVEVAKVAAASAVESKTTHASNRTAETAPEVSSDAPSELRGSTPLARRAAANHHVDLAAVEGSGPGGRVVESDVLRLTEADSNLARSTAPDTAHARPTTQAGLAGSRLQVGVRCLMDGVLDACRRLDVERAGTGDDARITPEDFVLRAVAMALRDVPEANVGWAGDALRVFDRVDLSIASIGAQAGSLALVLRDADRMGLSTLSAERRALDAMAREGSLPPEQTTGGTFSVSSRGVEGIETWVPIVNPPPACGLGVGAVEERAVVRQGEVVVGHEASFIFVADPRAVDVAVAARFLGALRKRLEDPLSMVL